MALPPTIPTSFVPKQVVVTRKSTIGFNPFLLVSYIIFTIWVIAAVLIFSYKWYLTKVSSEKTAEHITAQQNIDQASVNDFIRLRDRFTIAKQTLDKHVAVSQFFDKMEDITIQNARFTRLKLSVLDNRTAKIEMAGTARTFNALAAQSSAFTTDKDIKKAIFSGFVLDSKDGTVTFEVTADLDARIITQSVAPAATPQIQPVETAAPLPPQGKPVASSTPATP